VLLAARVALEAVAGFAAGIEKGRGDPGTSEGGRPARVE